MLFIRGEAYQPPRPGSEHNCNCPVRWQYQAISQVIRRPGLAVNHLWEGIRNGHLGRRMTMDKGVSCLQFRFRSVQTKPADAFAPAGPDPCIAPAAPSRSELYNRSRLPVPATPLVRRMQSVPHIRL